MAGEGTTVEYSREEFSLPQGSAVLYLPLGLSKDSASDVEDWLALVVRRIKRVANRSEDTDGERQKEARDNPPASTPSEGQDAARQGSGTQSQPATTEGTEGAGEALAETCGQTCGWIDDGVFTHGPDCSLLLAEGGKGEG
jgi:hypothetical protein